MENKPERAIVFELKVEADSEEDLSHALSDLATQIACGELSEASVSGGYSWSHVYSVKRNVITHDEYFEQINVLLGKEA